MDGADKQNRSYGGLDEDEVRWMLPFLVVLDPDDWESLEAYQPTQQNEAP